MRYRKGVDADERGDREELQEQKEGEGPGIRMRSMRKPSIFNKRERVR